MTKPSECCSKLEERELDFLVMARAGRERGGMRKGGNWRKGRGDYKDEMICDLGSHNRGELLEGDRINCVPPAHIFSESVHWYRSRLRVRVDDRDEVVRKYVAELPFPPGPMPLSGRDSCPVSMVGLSSDHLKEMKKCQHYV